MSPVLQGALIGLLGGLGLLLVIARLRARRVSLDDRLAPYLRAQRTSSGLLPAPTVRGPFATIERLVSPLMSDAVRLVTRLGSPTAELRRRLVRAGRTGVGRAVPRRAGGLGRPVARGRARARARDRDDPRRQPGGRSSCSSRVCGLSGVLVRDWLLSREITARESRMMAELPTVAELLALAVGAGEGAIGALERVVRTTHGELTGELAQTLADARAGMPLTAALDGLADRTGLSPLARFAEGVAVAVERGTPLADVLRAQAQDVREVGRRELMETGGRKEVAMMVPVVFLILPITVVFAVFPSMVVLRVGL